MKLIIALLIAATAFGCAQALSAEDEEALRIELTMLAEDIAASELENERYSGGLVKSLISARLAIFRQTKAMLEQRSAASSFSVNLSYTVDGKPFVLPSDAKEQAANIELELTALREKIKAQEEDAKRYRGGLVLSMKLSAIATMRQTEAMMQQRKLSLEYGLPQYIGHQVSTDAELAGETAKPKESHWEIVTIGGKVTERNDVWWKYAWKLVLKNKSNQAQTCNATVEFQDAEGFIVDSDRVRGLTVPAGGEETFTGFSLVTAEVAGNVARVAAKVQ